MVAWLCLWLQKRGGNYQSFVPCQSRRLQVKKRTTLLSWWYLSLSFIRIIIAELSKNMSANWQRCIGSIFWRNRKRFPTIFVAFLDNYVSMIILVLFLKHGGSHFYNTKGASLFLKMNGIILSWKLFCSILVESCRLMWRKTVILSVGRVDQFQKLFILFLSNDKIQFLLIPYFCRHGA